MSLLYDGGDGGDRDDRYGQFRLSEDELVVYDRENPNAWFRVTPPASLDA